MALLTSFISVQKLLISCPDKNDFDTLLHIFCHVVFVVNMLLSLCCFCGVFLLIQCCVISVPVRVTKKVSRLK